MERFGATLKRLRAAAGISQVEVAARLTALGLPYTDKAVSKWEQGATKPDAVAFLQLCKLYDVRDPYSVFLGSHEELNTLGLQRLHEYEGLLRRDTQLVETPQPAPRTTPRSVRRTVPRRTIRLFDIPVSAGTGVFLDESEFTMIYADDAVPYDADYALRISGDSMEPTFFNGQIIYVRKQETLDIGDIGIFIHNNDVYCKELGHGELISHNADYAPIPVSRYDAFYALGKVIG
jgi:phage repressor protein C with HTH and peptisase S24 domain